MTVNEVIIEIIRRNRTGERNPLGQPFTPNSFLENLTPASIAYELGCDSRIVAEHLDDRLQNQRNLLDMVRKSP